MYSPTLGRFMQTDPIGYSDGMNQLAYVGNDPLNFNDPTGLAKVCVIPPGSRIRKCILVDGDGDGDADEDDISGADKIALGRAFRGFILGTRHKDITGFAKPASGQGSENSRNWAYIIGQFAGAVFSDAGYDWSKVKGIWVGYKKDEPAAWSDGSRIALNTKFSFWKKNASDAARLILHESLHTNYSYWGASNAPWRLYWNHSWLDGKAKGLLKEGGLGGDGCIAYMVFKKC
ncbi:hypothetical protein GCM10023115_24250 [Pontixanthobacter gangjinensis]|uniref:RHS repeat-associated core domain-containing protein n=2 Tax=Pontixanthobacter gangjinensis TaxID=1028742 RepID=A0A6I4SPB3_9SPHN|nr:hypothetical protein [Pontixanthobacter gangjinensis]